MLFIILFSAGITIADEFIPLQNDSLNYTHVLFHWPQISSDITYTIKWKANNHPSGIYFVKLATNEYSQSKKLMFIK